MEGINNYANVMNYNYKTKDTKEKNNRLKDLKFSFLENIDLQSDQYLQGLCFTDQFILVTSYSSEQDTLGRLMVFDKQTGEYLVTLGMDKKSHLGGIAYDGENIWVCNSSKMSVERISYDFICQAAKQNKGKTIDVRNIVERYRVNNIPSCITSYNGKLWIATHTKLTSSQMAVYQYDDANDTLEDLSIYKIPSKVQGIAFDENGKVYLSTSYGRKNSSYVKIYSSVNAMTKNVNNYLRAIEMPPCSEGIDLYENNLYVVFESAGKKYLEGTDGNGTSLSPLDKILIIPMR